MTTIERRPHICHGYVCFTGKRLTNRQVDKYNGIQDEINAWIDAGRTVPEHLLNSSHAYFALVSGSLD